jgi:hypothetical protein
MQAQPGADSVHIVISGRATPGSSKVPARRISRFGRASVALLTGVPQAGQNRRRIVLPLSAVLTYSVVLPMMETAALGKIAFTVPLPAAKYWQSRHQHTRTATGSAATL